MKPVDLRYAVLGTPVWYYSEVKCWASLAPMDGAPLVWLALPQ